MKSQSDVLISEDDNCSDEDLDAASLINDDINLVNVNNNLTTNNVANLDAMTLEEKCLLPLPFTPSGGGGSSSTKKPSIHCYSMSSSTDNCIYLHSCYCFCCRVLVLIVGLMSYKIYVFNLIDSGGHLNASLTRGQVADNTKASGSYHPVTGKNSKQRPKTDSSLTRKTLTSSSNLIEPTMVKPMSVSIAVRLKINIYINWWYYLWWYFVRLVVIFKNVVIKLISIIKE